MWPVAVVVIMISLIGGFRTLYQTSDPETFKEPTLSLQATAENMLVYGHSVIAFTAAQSAGYTAPAPGNVVPDASLSLPSWHVRNPLWTNKVIGGVVTVYATSRPPAGDITPVLAEKSLRSRGVGVAQGGYIITSYGQTATLPAGIPNGVPVFQIKVN